jgi:CRISPR-associated protein Cmr1
LEIKLKTLTPIWTGGADGKCDRLHETGIIGSLRWWYEALVRGLGGYACDPTESGCTFDENEYRKSKAADERQHLLKAGVCDACQLFGCTGWARKFRIKMANGRELFDDPNVLIPSERVHRSKKGDRAGGWFVFNDSRMGEIIFDIIALRDMDLSPIYAILSLLSRHASLGPKGSNGYGVIQAEKFEFGVNWLNRFSNSKPACNNPFPDLRDFFFAKFQFEEPLNRPDWWRAVNGIRQAVDGRLDNGFSPRPLRKSQREIEQMMAKNVVPIAPAIRNWLRYSWTHELRPFEKLFVFGKAQPVCPNCYSTGFRKDNRDRNSNWCPNCRQKFKKGDEIPTTASKINVSYAYQSNNGKWEFRIWGWLPFGGGMEKRDEFLSSLQSVLQRRAIWQFVFGSSRINPKMIEWHSLDCQRRDGLAYLKELLGGAQ